MKQNLYNLILIFLLLFLILKYSKNKEQMMSISNSTRALNNQTSEEKNCCKITKKINEDETKFIYNYEILNSCDTDKIKDDNFSQTFIEGVNGWSNKYCNEDNKILGSCKRINFECKDFSRKDECEKFSMEWFGATTCESRYDKPIKLTPYGIPNV